MIGGLQLLVGMSVIVQGATQDCTYLSLVQRHVLTVLCWMDDEQINRQMSKQMNEETNTE